MIEHQLGPRAANLPESLLHHLELLVEADGAAALVFGLDGTALRMNEVARLALGVPDHRQFASSGAARELFRVVHAQLPPRLLSDPAGGSWRGDVDMSAPGAPRNVVSVTVVVHHDAASPLGGLLGVLARQVSSAAPVVDERGPAVGIPGVTHETDTLALIAKALDDASGGPGHVGLLLIDFDRMRDVNAAFGREVGDRLLAAAVQRLTAALRDADHVARVGGDEYLVLCPHLAEPAVGVDLADRLRRTLAGRLAIGDVALDMSVSVGVALTDEALLTDDTTHVPMELLSRAAQALRHAKQHGRNQTVLYTDQLGPPAPERNEIAVSLAAALEHDQLVMSYQPIFSAVSEHAEAMEAIAVWDQPGRGHVAIHDVLPLAEDIRVGVEVGDWALRTACARLREMLSADLVDRTFALHIAVSLPQLARAAFVNGVIGLLREFGLRPGQLVLEARRFTLLDDRSDVARSIRALRRVGVQVALDNFATGTAALSALTDIGADVLKLDGRLAMPDDSSETDTSVVRALVLLAHSLDMRVVAEGVDDIEQLRRLRAAGCDLVQGAALAGATDAAGLRAHVGL